MVAENEMSGNKIFVVILLFLFVIGLLVYSQFYSHVDTYYQQANADLNIIKDALDLYHSENGNYPNTLAELTTPVVKGGKIYLERLPKGPWGSYYLYKYPGEKNKGEYDLWSYGADKKEGGVKDNKDLTNW